MTAPLSMSSISSQVAMSDQPKLCGASFDIQPADTNPFVGDQASASWAIPGRPVSRRRSSPGMSPHTAACPGDKREAIPGVTPHAVRSGGDVDGSRRSVSCLRRAFRRAR